MNDLSSRWPSSAGEDSGTPEETRRWSDTDAFDVRQSEKVSPKAMIIFLVLLLATLLVSGVYWIMTQAAPVTPGV